MTHKYCAYIIKHTESESAALKSNNKLTLSSILHTQHIKGSVPSKVH